MPTKKKRVGFIPREDVMIIIDKLSIENNLSNSKIISILVEEALSSRGIFSKETGKINQSYIDNRYSSQEFFDDSLEFKNNKKFSNNNKSVNFKLSNKRNPSNQIIQDNSDLQTYKKFISFLKFKEMMEEFDI